MKDNVTGLQTKVISSYPNALFAHSYAHSINLVLQHRLAIIKECKIFFKTLSVLSTFFFLYLPNEYSPLINLCRRNCQQFLWKGRISPQDYRTVKEYRYQLCEFFENIIDEAEICDGGSVIKARGFLAFLEDFETVFRFLDNTSIRSIFTCV
jgi:hypothetical protein